MASRTSGESARCELPDSIFLPRYGRGVVSHGIVKERAVPPKEIDRALERRKRFGANPAKHRYDEHDA